MVNSKHAAFKVNKQTPANGPPPQAYSTVINCRKPGGKRASRVEKNAKPQQQRVRFARIPGVACTTAGEKKLRDEFESLINGEAVSGEGANAATSSDGKRGFTGAPPTSTGVPTKFRRGKVISKHIDLDTWFTIMRFSNPAQLLEMRTKIASCYRFLRHNPMLWKYSRDYYYRENPLPDPPSELTEFQYAHLRHGHGCMSCRTPSTRKTYWAFLRRWCKTCLHAKTIKASDAEDLCKDLQGADMTQIRKCLPSAIFDSWGNFVGVGPAATLSYKTIYLASDIAALVDEYTRESEKHGEAWQQTEMMAWVAAKTKVVEERKQFAHTMEQWEDSKRQSKSFKHHEKKQARKAYFAEKASQLVPPVHLREMEACASYRRAVAIPKAPNMTSWLTLKPKLEKEAADLRANGGAPFFPVSMSGSTTPSMDLY